MCVCVCVSIVNRGHIPTRTPPSDRGQHCKRGRSRFVDANGCKLPTLAYRGMLKKRENNVHVQGLVLGSALKSHTQLFVRPQFYT